MSNRKSASLLVSALGLALQVAVIPNALAGHDLWEHGSSYGKPRTYPDEVCHSLKLRAISDYYECLLKTGDKNAKQARCDTRFAGKFDRADRLSPQCPPLVNLQRIQRAIRDQAQAVLVGNVSSPPCQLIESGTDGQVTCELHKSGENTATSAVNLQDILTQVQTQDSSTCPTCDSVTAQTPLWLQAWGGRGGGGGGDAGFAQTVTTIDDLESSGTIVLYYYLGGTGGTNQTSGSSGGSATLVTTIDLQNNPSENPTDALLIAGGAGGYGGCDKGCIAGCPSPHGGGAGGVAIATTGPDGQGIGQGAHGGGNSGGDGGGENIGGGGSGGGQAGNPGIGGYGGGGGEGAGKHSEGSPGWFNTGATPLTFTSGAGGTGDNDTNSCTAGGGGGGGGWGGGGGAGHGNADTPASGGGGGGSYSIASTCNDVDAPITNPSTGASGNVFLIFNTQGTCQ